MKNLKAHHHLAIVGMLTLGIMSLWTWGAMVFAQTGSTQIEAWVGPPDACVNVPGYQMDVPVGMETDGSGNCSTPPPPPVDLCNNIDGMQLTLPDGYYRDASGNCYVQPVPPKDVCKNLAGVQETVPPGYRLAEDGTCNRPPSDRCNNIPGTQPIVPANMVRNSAGDCFTPNTIAPPSTVTTPDPPSNPWVPPAEPREPVVTPSGETDLKNVPEFLEDFVQMLVDLIPETVKEALRSVAPVLAVTFPFVVIGTQFAATSMLGASTALRSASVSRMTSANKHLGLIADEKDAFSLLITSSIAKPLEHVAASASSHNNPMVLGVIQRLKQTTNALHDTIQSRSYSAGLAKPERYASRTDMLSSALFWLPIIITGGLVLASDFLLGVVGEVELGTVTLWLQVGLFATSAIFFYGALQAHYLKGHAEKHQLALHNFAGSLDDKRNAYLARASEELHELLAQASIKHGTGSTELSSAQAQIERLLTALHMLSQIQINGAMIEVVDIKTMVDEALARHQSQLDAHGITVVNNLGNAKVMQHRKLFEFVLGSLIETALTTSPNGSTLTIDATPHKKTISLSITETGADIDTSVLNDPTKSAQAVSLSYDTPTFGLLLDQLVMDASGSSFRAESNPASHSTTFTVTSKIA